MSELQNVVKELTEVYKAGGMKTTRFSITLSERDNSRLESLADGLQISKQELISKLLLAALSDLENTILKQVFPEEIDTKDDRLPVIDDDDLPF